MTIRKIRVLFVDDDGSIRIFANAMFNKKMFDIDVASDTSEAERMLREGSYDVIVCDVMMPGEDGIQFCERLQKSGKSIPILFLSAVSQVETVHRGLTAGARAYLVKPFDVHELEKHILSVIAPLSKNPPSS